MPKKENVKSIGLKNVEFVGRVKREYIPALMKISDVLRQASEYVDGSERDVIIYSREGLDQ